MGRVIRAYRCHPWHGTAPLPQEAVGRWLNVTQCQISRLENGSPRTNLDWLRFVARTLRIPAGRLWFTLNGQTVDDEAHTWPTAQQSANSLSPPGAAAKQPARDASATVHLEVAPGTQLTVTLDQNSQAPIRLLISTTPENPTGMPAPALTTSTEGGARLYSLDAHRKHA